MYITNQYADLITQKPGLQGMYEIVEQAARVCYNQEHKVEVVDGVSIHAEKFFNKLNKVLKHHSVFEHATIYLMADQCTPEVLNNKWIHRNGDYITLNYRVLIDEECEHLAELSHQTEHHIPRYTFRFITSRDISAELIRYGVMSFTERSTRYTAFGDMGVVKSCTMDLTEENECNEIWLETNRFIEKQYKELLSRGVRPEMARRILPLGLETIMYMTGTIDEWNNVINERYHGTTGVPHPDAKDLIGMVYDKLNDGEG